MTSLPFRTPRRRSRPRAVAVLAFALAAVPGLAGCNGDGGTGLEGLRFGQVGQVTARLVAPKFPDGTLEQELVWNSEGPWRLEESISYDGVVGDRTVIRGSRNPEILAGEYAIWITQANEDPLLGLFVDDLDPGLDPECPAVELTLTIHDALRNESVTWTRCVTSSLGSLVPGNSGPDLAAPRVTEAVLRLRQPTVGDAFMSEYQETAPFATIAQGEDSQATLPSPLTITDAQEWGQFWSRHTGGSGDPPEVDFAQDLVIVAAVGERQEAGDSVEVRAVLPSRETTAVKIVERIPGDFCSPVARTHTPFHIVRAPREFLPSPLHFIELEPELVPCGA